MNEGQLIVATKHGSANQKLKPCCIVLEDENTKEQLFHKLQ